MLATGDVFVTDPLVRARLAEVASLVDMEGYAVAYACRQFGVPVRLVKHVSDDADEGALDWPARVDAERAGAGGVAPRPVTSEVAAGSCRCGAEMKKRPRGAGAFSVSEGGLEPPRPNTGTSTSS